MILLILHIFKCGFGATLFDIMRAELKVDANKYTKNNSVHRVPAIYTYLKSDREGTKWVALVC